MPKSKISKKPRRLIKLKTKKGISKFNSSKIMQDK